MTQYLKKSFSVGVGGDQQYRDNWDAIFGKKKLLEEQKQLAELGTNPDVVLGEADTEPALPAADEAKQ